MIEDLRTDAFGNRVPQFIFEVIRAAQGTWRHATTDLARAVQGVALMPGTGEYALATTPVHYAGGPGSQPYGQHAFSIWQ